ncbi:MAG: hypothetical protein KF857_10730 [Fimbriimonadaceae bacterium]|nr:hypothetical protein [Fimbriimonadaceae bacterium]
MGALVSLSYDGTLLCHLNTALPALDRHGLKGTFYAEPTLLLESVVEWRAAQKAGHEMGNGCLFGSSLPDGSLPAWTPQMIVDDVEEADFLLEELFPEQTDHSLGLPWGNDVCADGLPYLDDVGQLFNVVRTGVTGLNNLPKPDNQRLACVPTADFTGRQLVDVVKTAERNRSWVVFAFEGVGTGDNAVDAAAHDFLLDYLVEANKSVTVLPVIAAAYAATGVGTSPLRLA